MNDLNPMTPIFIGWTTVGGWLFGRPLIGAFVGLTAVIVVSVWPQRPW